MQCFNFKFGVTEPKFDTWVKAFKLLSSYVWLAASAELFKDSGGCSHGVVVGDAVLARPQTQAALDSEPRVRGVRANDRLDRVAAVANDSLREGTLPRCPAKAQDQERQPWLQRFP